jgi:carbon-monoxide dehydrogenase catalytic subunit
MGSCVDISRIILLVNAVAKHLNMDIPKLPVVGIAPEWMSEKAVAIGNYVIGSGIDTFLGVYPQVTGSAEMVDLLTNRVEDIVGAKFTVEMDPAKLSEQVLERIEAKRTALGI